MAKHFGGSDGYRASTQSWPSQSIGTLAWWMRTTQATTNVGVTAEWTGSSRQGLGVILNNAAGKVSIQGYNGGSAQFGLTTAATINDGNWHHIACNYAIGPGSPYALYVDGVQETSGTTGNTWFFNSTVLDLGDLSDNFWPNYVGDLAEWALWDGRQLSASEIKGLAGGIQPRFFSDKLWCYLQLMGAIVDRYSGKTFTTGGSPSTTDHPRCMGGLMP